MDDYDELRITSDNYHSYNNKKLLMMLLLQQ
jgi:hypothetical protein